LKYFFLQKKNDYLLKDEPLTNKKPIRLLQI